ncbi:MAG: hypothetical protein ACP5RI_02870 [Candidatus Micrarchaeia archaeon]|uniref:hypothetical protein n=1 Tax=Caldisericum sp. TaxID=2499687 RepID=UPI003D0F9082
MVEKIQKKWSKISIEPEIAIQFQNMAKRLGITNSELLEAFLIFGKNLRSSDLVEVSQKGIRKSKTLMF